MDNFFHFKFWFKDEEGIQQVNYDTETSEVLATFNNSHSAMAAKKKLEDMKNGYNIRFGKNTRGSSSTGPVEPLKNEDVDIFTKNLLRTINLHLTKQQLYEEEESEDSERFMMIQSLILRYTLDICENTKTWEDLSKKLRPWEEHADTKTLIKQLKTRIDKEKATTKKTTAPSQPAYHQSAPIPKARPTGSTATAKGERYKKSKQ